MTFPRIQNLIAELLPNLKFGCTTSVKALKAANRNGVPESLNQMITTVTQFLVGSKLAEDRNIMYDLATNSRLKAEVLGSTLESILISVNLTLHTYFPLIGVMAHFKVGMSRDVFLTELSVELMSRMVDIYERKSPNLDLPLYHARTPQVIIAMQKWRNWKTSLYLCSKLQFLGFPADFRADPILSIEILRNSIISQANIYVILVIDKNAYRVDSKLNATDNPVLWRTEFFSQEQNVISHLLGLVAGTKSNVRSIVLRLSPTRAD